MVRRRCLSWKYQPRTGTRHGPSRLSSPWDARSAAAVCTCEPCKPCCKYMLTIDHACQRSGREESLHSRAFQSFQMGVLLSMNKRDLTDVPCVSKWDTESVWKPTTVALQSGTTSEGCQGHLRLEKPACCPTRTQRKRSDTQLQCQPEVIQ